MLYPQLLLLCISQNVLFRICLMSEAVLCSRCPRERHHHDRPSFLTLCLETLPIILDFLFVFVWMWEWDIYIHFFYVLFDFIVILNVPSWVLSPCVKGKFSFLCFVYLCILMNNKDLFDLIWFAWKWTHLKTLLFS